MRLGDVRGNLDVTEAGARDEVEGIGERVIAVRARVDGEFQKRVPDAGSESVGFSSIVVLGYCDACL